MTGTPLTATLPQGPLSLTVGELKGKPGAQFNLVRRSRLSTIEGLQAQLRLAEKGERAAALTALVGVCEAAADEHARKARRLARGLQAAIAAAIVLAALLLLWPFLPRS